MAGFTGSIVTTESTPGVFVTHLVRVNTGTALCGAPVAVKGLSLRITSPEVGQFLHTLLKHETSACAACLVETRELD